MTVDLVVVSVNAEEILGGGEDLRVFFDESVDDLVH